MYFIKYLTQAPSAVLLGAHQAYILKTKYALEAAVAEGHDFNKGLAFIIHYVKTVVAYTNNLAHFAIDL